MARRLTKPVARARKHSSYADNVYEHLKADILKGDVEPGERLREDDVSARFHVSRTPVREAFNRLEADGLIVDSPGRGLVAAEFGEEEILEGYEIRGVLEGVAARLAAQRASDLDIHKLELLLDAQVKAASAGEFEAAMRLSGEFHFQLWRVAGNRRLLKLMRDIEATMGRYQRLTLVYPGRSERAIHEHRELLETIRAHDPDRAEARAREHMREAQRVQVALSVTGDLRESRPR